MGKHPAFVCLDTLSSVDGPLQRLFMSRCSVLWWSYAELRDAKSQKFKNSICSLIWKQDKRATVHLSFRTRWIFTLFSLWSFSSEFIFFFSLSTHFLCLFLSVCQGIWRYHGNKAAVGLKQGHHKEWRGGGGGGGSYKWWRGTSCFVFFFSFSSMTNRLYLRLSESDLVDQLLTTNQHVT